MLSPKRTALYLAIGAMAFAAGEASAGCKYISGSYVCASWIKGSEVCEIATTGGGALQSATCSVTGVNTFVVDGGEGPQNVYCASGALPPGLCESGSGGSLFSSVSSNISAAAGATPKKPKKEKECKSKHKDKNGKHKGHDDSCADIIVPGDEIFLSAEATDPVCTPDGFGGFNCTASAEILPPPGSTCSNGEPAIDFTASEMLAIVEACVDDGYGGQICDKTYDYCTVDPLAPDGTPYDCVDISFQYPDPEAASCPVPPPLG